MKMLLTQVLLITVFIFGCATFEDNSAVSEGTRKGEIYNIDGQYNGVWRFLSGHEYYSRDISFNEVPEENFYHIDSFSQKVSDTSMIILLWGDSTYIYTYYGEETYNIEYTEIGAFDEYNEDEGADTLKPLIKELFTAENIQITNYNFREIDTLTLSGDTLRTLLGWNISADFSATLNGVDVTGKLVNEAGLLFTLEEYTGTFPPESWPKDSIVDSGE